LLEKLNIMTKTSFPQIALTAFFLLFLVAFSSCGKDEDTNPSPDKDPDTIEDPVPLPAPVTTIYEGELTYTPPTGSTDLPIFTDNATATIEENGDTYTIRFSDNVPSLSNLKFKRDGDEEYASISDSGVLTGVSIDGDDLDIGATLSGETWAFSGSK